MYIFGQYRFKKIFFISQLNILSTMYVTQNKLHQSNNAFQHTHNHVDEEDTQKLIKVIKVHNAHKDHSIQC